MFSQAKLLWIVSLHWARNNFPTISKSCHCIISKCLLWLKAEGQVQGLRSVTSSQCLPFIMTLKTVTRPWFLFSFLSVNMFYTWWQKCATTWHVDIVFNTYSGWWTMESLRQNMSRGAIECFDHIKFYCSVCTYSDTVRFKTQNNITQTFSMSIWNVYISKCINTFTFWQHICI